MVTTSTFNNAATSSEVIKGSNLFLPGISKNNTEL
jgi:hypothetical protein